MYNVKPLESLASYIVLLNGIAKIFVIVESSLEFLVVLWRHLLTWTKKEGNEIPRDASFQI